MTRMTRMLSERDDDENNAKAKQKFARNPVNSKKSRLLKLNKSTNLTEEFSRENFDGMIHFADSWSSRNR